MRAALTVLGWLPPRPYVPRADLTNVQLSGAWLVGADLTGANLATAKNLTQDQLSSAQGDDQTKLPAGLDPPAHWSADS